MLTLSPMYSPWALSPAEKHDPFNSLSILASPVPSWSGLASPTFGADASTPAWDTEPISDASTWDTQPRSDDLIPRQVHAIHNLRVDTKAPPHYELPTPKPKQGGESLPGDTSLRQRVFKAAQTASIAPPTQVHSLQEKPLQQDRPQDVQQALQQDLQQALQQVPWPQDVQQMPLPQDLQQVPLPQDLQQKQVEQVQVEQVQVQQLALQQVQYPRQLQHQSMRPPLPPVLPAAPPTRKRKRAPTEQKPWVLPYTSPLFLGKGIDAERRRAILGFCMQYPGQGFTMATILTHLYPGLDKVNRKRVRNHYAASWSLNRVERHLDKSATLSHAQGVLYRYLNDTKATFQFVPPASHLAQTGETIAPETGNTF